jgi:hypothetical protein
LSKSDEKPKSLGEAIDEIINALAGLSESARRTAIRAASEHLNVQVNSESVSATIEDMPSVLEQPRLSQTRSVDIRTFKEEKQPSSAMEMAATVAYYLSELAPLPERKSEVQVEDMLKYFKQASFPLPKSPQFLLVNAKNAGYFDSIGGGNYKLNTVGYNLVAHNLPRDHVLKSGGRVSKKRRTAAAKKATKSKRSVSPKT